MFGMCPGPESNRYAPIGTQEFKSWASTYSATRANLLCCQKNGLSYGSCCLVFRTVHAFIFERRQIPPPKFAYFVYPVVGTIPGVQTFYGAGLRSGPLPTANADLTFVSLAGETKYFRNNEKFRINLLTVIDVPVFTNHLQVSGVYSDVRNGTIQQTQRGINSDKDKTFYLMAKRAFISGIDVSLSFFDDPA
ncbi:hypothetical protein CHS0354_006855 [Potamilus streckersoni]|uniref:Uncharacterized protein n=1 Tax=Potamilus streckersoni TaxID=2493646 RepID=A0AAE0TEG1_9BIVA|nr:hypothetical protein CHS0354_006855 [Potamilus streckersoni]